MVETNYFSANITCYFAVGATGLGCLASFGSILEINISRLLGSNVAMETVTFSQALGDPLDVSMAEILADGSVSSIRLQPLINITSTTTTPSKEQHSDNIHGVYVRPWSTSECLLWLLNVHLVSILFSYISDIYNLFPLPSRHAHHFSYLHINE